MLSQWQCTSTIWISDRQFLSGWFCKIHRKYLFTSLFACRLQAKPLKVKCTTKFLVHSDSGGHLFWCGNLFLGCDPNFLTIEGMKRVCFWAQLLIHHNRKRPVFLLPCPNPFITIYKVPRATGAKLQLHTGTMQNTCFQRQTKITLLFFLII